MQFNTRTHPRESGLPEQRTEGLGEPLVSKTTTSLVKTMRILQSLEIILSAHSKWLYGIYRDRDSLWLLSHIHCFTPTKRSSGKSALKRATPGGQPLSPSSGPGLQKLSLLAGQPKGPRLCSQARSVPRQAPTAPSVRVRGCRPAVSSGPRGPHGSQPSSSEVLRAQGGGVVGDASLPTNTCSAISNSDSAT